MKKIILMLGCLGMIVFGSIGIAGAITFDLGSNNSPEYGTSSSPTGNYWQLGSGWGWLGYDNDGLLDATFNVSNSLPSVLFDLNTVGANYTFRFGDITLYEDYIGNGTGGTSNETNDLGVTAWIHFDLPAGLALVGNPGNAIAVFGDVDDSATDLTISFAPVTVAFGTGGQFTVNLSDISFNDDYQTRYLDATVTLNAVPNAVPEPATMLLLGMGLLGMGFVGRRRFKK